MVAFKICFKTPAGATTLPKGDVIVLENYWFKDENRRMEIRLRRIRKDKFKDIHGGDLIVSEELAHFGSSKSGILDRFEGIASCIGRNSKTLLYLISDDNLPNKNGGSQRTLLLMFELSDDPK